MINLSPLVLYLTHQPDSSKSSTSYFTKIDPNSLVEWSWEHWKHNANVSWLFSAPSETLLLETHIVTKGWLILTIFYSSEWCYSPSKSNKLIHKYHMYILPNTINFCRGTTKHRVLLFSFYHLYILAFLNRNAYRILILHDSGFRARFCLMQSNDWSTWFSGGKKTILWQLFWEIYFTWSTFLWFLALLSVWP